MSDLELIDPEEAVEELAAIEAELARRKYSSDPVFWAQHRLGDTIWSKQKQIIESVRDNRRTAVQSCHQMGKSYIASVVIGWWLDIHKPGDAFVVTSAPSGPQVKAILWREIGRVHARGRLMGRVNQTEWLMRYETEDGTLGKEELVAFGRKPDDYDPTAFQGIHAPYVLIVWDEACGIPLSLWEAGDSLIANDTSKALAIGNPDDPLSEFYNVCSPGSGYNVISVSAFDTPNFTNEPMPERVKRQLIGKMYVEEKRRKQAPLWFWVNKYGAKVDVPAGGGVPEEAVRVVHPPGTDETATNPVWQSKVLGRFPSVSEEGALIPLHWIRRAQQKDIEPNGEKIISLDVGAGGDESTCGEYQGGHFRILWEDTNPDTMETCGRFVSTLKERKANQGRVDKIGIGKGVADRTAELRKDGKLQVDVRPVDVSWSSNEPDDYYNIRSEAWWKVREDFENDRIDIDMYDEDLAAELSTLRYKRHSNGTIQVESKADAKKRGIPSPNRADALMLAKLRLPKKITRATFGRRH